MKCFHFFPRSRFTLASFSYTLLFLTVIVYFEFLQVWFNGSNWKRLKSSGIRILIIADPQLLGEHGELPIVGHFTRWHADRYIYQNYRIAKYYTEPHIVIFLGDLFDEGSTATQEESERYLRRFQSVFQLSSQEQSDSKVVYIHVPGDNDVGGEGREVINVEKLGWFNRTVEDIQSSVLFQTAFVNLQFLKTNLFIPKLPVTNGTEFNSAGLPLIKTALSHYPCMAVFEACSKMLLQQKPNILISAHTHDGAYYQYNSDANIKYVLPNLLLPSMTSIAGTYEAAKKMGLEVSSNSVRFDLRNQSVFHEFLSPTCSYRMGRPNVGFGLLTIAENGDHGSYGILWLPNGFKPLLIYITFYIVSKLIFTPWILYKFLHWAWPKLSPYLRKKSFRKSSQASDKAHLV